MGYYQGRDDIKPVSLEGLPTALDCNGNKLVKIGKYWFSTDVNRFWELLNQDEDEYIVFMMCLYNSRIFSTNKRYFMRRTRRTVYQQFEKKRMVFIDPASQRVYQGK